MTNHSGRKDLLTILTILKRLEKRQEVNSKSLILLEKWQKTQGVKTAYVTTAVKLKDVEVKELAVNLGFIYGKNFTIEQRVDPTVLGGLKIKIGSQIFDSTLAGQLEKIKTSLKKITR